MANPCPPRDDIRGSTTLIAAAVAIAASKAFPPSIRTRIPAIDARGSSDVTIALRPVTRGRSANCALDVVPKARTTARVLTIEVVRCFIFGLSLFRQSGGLPDEFESWLRLRRDERP